MYPILNQIVNRRPEKFLPSGEPPGGPPIGNLAPRRRAKLEGVESAQLPLTPASSQTERASARRREQASFYEQIGGEETIRRITERFYEQVADDPTFREMYPEEDLGPAEERLRLFLQQYWGGPTTYSDTRGHPRLRMRHQPFVIDPAARDLWLKYMRVALKEAGLAPLHEATFWDYLERAAHSLVNTF